MNKKLFILPLLAMALIGCGEGGGGQGGGGQGGGGGGQGGGGGSGDTITVARALEIIGGLADGGVTTEEYIVGGYVSTGFAPKESSQTKGTWNFDMADTADGSNKLIVWYAAASTAPVQGKKINVKGKLSKYKDNKSGAVKSELTDGTVTWMEDGGDTPTPTPPSPSGSGLAGHNASKTGNVPADAKTLTWDFNNITGDWGDSGNKISKTSSKTPVSGTVTKDGIGITYNACIVHEKQTGSSTTDGAYLGLCAKNCNGEGKGGISTFGISSASWSKVYKVQIFIQSGSGVSSLANYVIDYGTSTITNSTASATGEVLAAGANGEAYASGDFKYFAISCVQGTSSTGKSTYYNGYLSKIVISYAA